MNEPMKLKLPPSLFSPPYTCVCFLAFAPFPIQMQNLASYWFLQEISHSPSLFHIPFTSLLPLSLPPTFFPSFVVCYLSSPLQSLPILSSLLYLLPSLPGAAFASFFSVSRLIEASFCFNKGKSVPKGEKKITPAAKRVTFSSHYRILGLEMPLELKCLRGS